MHARSQEDKGMIKVYMIEKIIIFNIFFIAYVTNYILIGFYTTMQANLL